MTCTKCRKQITKGHFFHRMQNGPHHCDCAKPRREKPLQLNAAFWLAVWEGLRTIGLGGFATQIGIGGERAYRLGVAAHPGGRK